MDAVSEPGVSEITWMASAQVGKTEGLINNTVGYHIDQDPAPMLIVLETEPKAEAWSKERLTPMLKDTPCLVGKIRDSRARDSGNTIPYKEYPGGFLAIAGAGSEAELSSRPIRIVLLDELDKYKTLRAGDPEMLAIKRTQTFWNKKIIRVSTPRDKSTSRILRAYERSNMQKFYVPCPLCNEYQVLVWDQVKFSRDEKGVIERTWYECIYCHGEIDHSQKTWMLAHGEWRAGNPKVTTHAGFWLNEIYSPWSTWQEMAANFLEAKKSPDTLKTFINESLGEVWNDEGYSIKDDVLYARREDYGSEVPLEAAVLTCSVDVQGNRLESEVIAWGAGEESWKIEYRIFQGDPARLEVWKDLEAYLDKTFLHESGQSLRIWITLIDTGGHHTQMAYNFVKARERRGIYGIKGANKSGEPIWPKRATRKNKGGINLYMIGTDGAKDLIYGRLKITEPGPGYIHFPSQYDEEYFRQLTSEKVVYEKGVRKWILKAGARNEALDLNVYGVAALERLKQSHGFNLDKLVDKMVALGKREQSETGPDQVPALQRPSEPEKTTQSRRRIINPGIKKKWVTGWKR